MHFRAIHKRRLLKGGGRGGGQKYRNLLSKKATKGEGGGYKIGKNGPTSFTDGPIGKEDE